MTDRQDNSRDGGPWLFDVLSRHRGLAAITVLSVLAGAVIGLLAGRPGEPEYRAKAVVVASALEMRVEFLPRTAAAIFEGGRVAEIAAQRIGGDVEPDELIPHIIDLEPVENTPVVNVVAEHPNPEVAALYATAAAEALVIELNRVGPGLGSFVVNVRASVPSDPIPTSRLPALAGGLLAGLAFAAGIIALSLLLRPAAPDPSLGAEAARAAPSGDEKTSEDDESVSTPPPSDQPAPVAATPPPPPPPIEEPEFAVGSDAASAVSADTAAPRPAVTPQSLDRSTIDAKPSLNGGGQLDPAESADDLTVVRGIGKSYAARLGRAGIHSVAELAAADSADLAERAEVRPALAERWIGQARRLTDDERTYGAGDDGAGDGASGDGASGDGASANAAADDGPLESSADSSDGH